ncbi:protein of unknown function [Paenibacillus sp. 1_12]|uniref:DUF4179 domain-containing protein n=1 Tax=Paenibacillus sp. 1_12 TaxID=1566278 RepID=UPI0008EC4086|nr:DUF4179 domain-containing protein [Paenibacillus sp. 1_12]SFM15261.1 protein of unknown function [Paenibacillus sp. 1_12]
MKCWSAEEADLYLASWNVHKSTHKACLKESNLNGQGVPFEEIQQHIRSCTTTCRIRFEECQREQSQWAEQLYPREDALPSSFTADLMAQLDDVELTAAYIENVPSSAFVLSEAESEIQQEFTLNPQEAHSVQSVQSMISVPSSLEPKYEQEPLPMWNSWFLIRKRKWMFTTAALILLISSTLAVIASPTLAEYVRSLFMPGVVDYGLLKSQELGLVNDPNIKVKDQGYTMEINEVVADSTRVVMALKLTGPDGLPNHNMLELSGPNEIQITDRNGNKLGELHDIGMTSQMYVLVAHFPQEIQADELMIQATISRLGNEILRIPYIQGKWNFAFYVNLKKAKALTTVQPLNQSYTTDNGMTIRMKRLVRTPSGVRLDLDTELSAAAAERSSAKLREREYLMFHFEDESGQEIHSVMSMKFPHIDSLLTSSRVKDPSADILHWSYSFKYLLADSFVRFVFDGYIVPELTEGRFTFRPSDLSSHPAIFRHEGDELRLTGFEMDDAPDPREHRKEAVLRVQGKFRNHFASDEWVLKDAAGNEYPVNYRGGSSTIDGYVTLDNEFPGKDYAFRIPTLQAIPEQLTLIRKVIDRIYLESPKNGWSFILNDGGRANGR